MIYHEGFGEIISAKNLNEDNIALTSDYEIKIKLRSFKSSEHIFEKGDGPYRGKKSIFILIQMVLQVSYFTRKCVALVLVCYECQTIN